MFRLLVSSWYKGMLYIQSKFNLCSNKGILLQPKATLLIFIFDNHSTQKSYTIVAFFQWIQPQINQRCGINCKILVIFLICGHTHNRLDQANSEPWGQYFTAPLVESLPDYVWINTNPNLNNFRHKQSYNVEKAIKFSTYVLFGIGQNFSRSIWISKLKKFLVCNR